MTLHTAMNIDMHPAGGLLVRVRAESDGGYYLALHTHDGSSVGYHQLSLDQIRTLAREMTGAANELERREWAEAPPRDVICEEHRCPL